jgi:hypothetical protein
LDKSNFYAEIGQHCVHAILRLCAQDVRNSQQWRAVFLYLHDLEIGADRFEQHTVEMASVSFSTKGRITHNKSHCFGAVFWVVTLRG